MPNLPTFEEGDDDFSKLKKLNNFLKNNEGTMQVGGVWDSTNVSNEVETFYRLPEVKEELKDKNSIQSILNKCQDLEVLYAIKHFEFMEILKPITYFLIHYLKIWCFTYLSYNYILVLQKLIN